MFPQPSTDEPEALQPRPVDSPPDTSEPLSDVLTPEPDDPGAVAVADYPVDSPPETAGATIESPLPSTVRVTPVAVGERSMALDVLRGFAVFGILFVNIESFAMITAARRNPDFGGGNDSLNYAIWLLTMLLADRKFIALFSMMFGAGAVVMVKRWKQAGRNPIPLYYRRMLCLMAFGLFHGFFIWDGDILFFYGAYGCLLFFFLRVRGDLLLLLGLALILLEGRVWGWPHVPRHIGIGVIEQHYLTGTWQQAFEFRQEDMTHNVEDVIRQFALEGIGFMCIGMALLKGGVLTGHRGRAAYATMALAGFAVGIAISGFPTGWFTDFEGWGGPLFVFGSLFVSFAWIGTAILLAKTTPRFFLTRAFANVGRMALTNYISHSIVCTSIFYGHGLGLFQQMDRAGQVKLVLGICAVQLATSSIWLTFFRFGPLEWVWRTVTYWRIQPFLRRAAVAGSE